MTTSSDEELSRIGEALELQLASARPDGTIRPYVTMWVVRGRRRPLRPFRGTARTTRGSTPRRPALWVASGPVVWSRR